MIIITSEHGFADFLPRNLKLTFGKAIIMIVFLQSYSQKIVIAKQTQSEMHESVQI